MAKKKGIVKLLCGVEAENWFYLETEWLSISLIDLYRGYGQLSSMKLLAQLFAELDDMGFSSTGISRVEGLYGSTDDLLLEVSRKNIKLKPFGV